MPVPPRPPLSGSPSGDQSSKLRVWGERLSWGKAGGSRGFLGISKVFLCFLGISKVFLCFLGKSFRKSEGTFGLDS